MSSASLSSASVSSSEDAEAVMALDEPIAKGAYGRVHRGRLLATGGVIAVKVVSGNAGAENEVRMLERLSALAPQHANIVALLAAHRCRRTGELWIALEFMAGGSLQAVMAALGEPLSEPEIVTAAHDVLQALAFLHRHDVIHRDVKAGNVLVQRESAHVKLTDFGVAAVCRAAATRSSVIGTPSHMAPEMIDYSSGTPSPYTAKVDVWALGITLIELAQMRPPHHDANPMRAFYLIPMMPPPSLAEPERWSPEFVRFQHSCTRKDQHARPLVPELLADPWFVGRRVSLTTSRRSAHLPADLPTSLDVTAPGRAALRDRIERCVGQRGGGAAGSGSGMPKLSKTQQIALALADLDDSSSHDTLDDADAAALMAAIATDDDVAGEDVDAEIAQIAASAPPAAPSSPIKFQVAMSPSSSLRRARFIGTNRRSQSIDASADGAAALHSHGGLGSGGGSGGGASSSSASSLASSLASSPSGESIVAPPSPSGRRGSELRRSPLYSRIAIARSSGKLGATQSASLRVPMQQVVERKLIQKHLDQLRKTQQQHEKETEKLQRQQAFEIRQNHAAYLVTLQTTASRAQALQQKLAATQATRQTERARQNEAARLKMHARAATSIVEHVAQVKVRQRAERKNVGDYDAESDDMFDAAALSYARLPKRVQRLVVEQRHEVELARVQQRAAMRDLASLHRVQLDDAQRATTWAAHDLAERHHAGLNFLTQLSEVATEQHAAALVLQLAHWEQHQRLLLSQMQECQALEVQQQQQFSTVAAQAARKAADARRKAVLERVKASRRESSNNKDRLRAAAADDELDALMRAVDAELSEQLRRCTPVLDDLRSYHQYQQRRLSDMLSARRQSLVTSLKRLAQSNELAMHTLHYRLRMAQLYEREHLWRNAVQGELSLADALYERRRELMTRHATNNEMLAQQHAAERRVTALREHCDAALVDKLASADFGLAVVRNGAAAEDAALREVHQRERESMLGDLSKKIALASTEIESLDRERLAARFELLQGHGDEMKRLRTERIALRRRLALPAATAAASAGAAESGLAWLEAPVVPPATLEALFAAARADSVEQVLAVALAHAPRAVASVLRSVDDDGRGVLHHAVRGGGGTAVLEHFASVAPSATPTAQQKCIFLETADNSCYTPALLAARLGQLAALEALLDLGAEARVVDDHGNTIMHWLARASVAGASESTLYADLLDVVMPLCKLHSRNRVGDTPLHIAAMHGGVACARLLVAHVDVNQRNAYGDTPLHAAARAGDATIVQILLDAGALPTLEGMHGDAWRAAQLPPVPAGSAAVLDALNATDTGSQRYNRRVIDAPSTLLDEAISRLSAGDCATYFALDRGGAPASPRSPTRGASPAPNSSSSTADGNPSPPSATTSSGWAASDGDESSSSSDVEPEAPTTVSPVVGAIQARRSSRSPRGSVVSVAPTTSRLRPADTLSTIREESPSPPPPPLTAPPQR
jgi:serine/threonine protein kinase/ankyrin repeat protein